MMSLKLIKWRVQENQSNIQPYMGMMVIVIILCLCSCVQITKETFQCLQDKYIAEPYKNIQIKDMTYFITGRKLDITPITSDSPLYNSVIDMNRESLSSLEYGTISDSFSFDIQETPRTSISSC